MSQDLWIAPPRSQRGGARLFFGFGSRPKNKRGAFRRFIPQSVDIDKTSLRGGKWGWHNRAPLSPLYQGIKKEYYLLSPKRSKDNTRACATNSSIKYIFEDIKGQDGVRVMLCPYSYLLKPSLRNQSVNWLRL